MFVLIIWKTVDCVSKYCKTIFSDPRYKGFSKFIKGKQFQAFICHNMTFYVIFIKIWQESISSSLESKEKSGPQQMHLLIQFWLNNCFKVKTLKSGSENKELFGPPFFLSTGLSTLFSMVKEMLIHVKLLRLGSFVLQGKLSW